MSKFNSVAAEAAYAITLHSAHIDGFGGVTDYGRWHALAYVSAPLLSSLEEPADLVERFRAEHGSGTLTVWLSEDSQGFVDAHAAEVDRTIVERKFRQEEANYYEWAREYDNS